MFFRLRKYIYGVLIRMNGKSFPFRSFSLYSLLECVCVVTGVCVCVGIPPLGDIFLLFWNNKLQEMEYSVNW